MTVSITISKKKLALCSITTSSARLRLSFTFNNTEKVVKKNTEAALILSKDMSIADELVEYLKYVLCVNEDNIPEIVGLFNDYTSKTDME